MGSWRKMGAFLGLVPGEDRTADEYDVYGRYDTYDGDMGSDAPMTHGALAMQPRPSLRPERESTSSASRPLTVKLSGFAEARIIGERYRQGTSVILDMTDLTDADARRVVDFAAGLAFALHGSIDKVTARVFMLLPPHTDMSAEDRRAVAGDYAAR